MQSDFFHVAAYNLYLTAEPRGSEKLNGAGNARDPVESWVLTLRMPESKFTEFLSHV